MPTLTIRQGHQIREITFTPPQRLSALLEGAGVQAMHPCGGRGVCGKCAVLLEGLVSAPNAAEEKCGVRLSCQAVATGDATVILPQCGPVQIENGRGIDLVPVRPMSGRVGAAVDVGTTTLALQLYGLADGRCLGGATMLNPQTSVAADVIGRMDAALKGGQAALKTAVEGAIAAMLRSACAQAGIGCEEVEALVITGNTTMLYLLTGRSPESLSRAPFAADCLFGEEIALPGRRCYLPPCLHAFVGADTACALLASGMLDKQATALLCDIGTNGEIALWHRGKLYVASTAAGPAFEGAGISCGCGSIPGAIDRAEASGGGVQVHTIGDEKAVGVCGSGLVDAVAAMLALGVIDETGAMEDDAFALAEHVALNRRDIRAVQLAKAAMAAGTAALLHAAGCSEEQVETVYLAGGFGSHLNMESAAAIGLIAPALAGKVQVIGNAALDGAALLLMDASLRDKLAQWRWEHIRLDGNAFFTQRYVEEMLFPE